VDKNDGDRPDANASKSIGIAFDLGLRLGISVILGLGGGLLLDSWLHTSPIFTLVGMLLGIAAAMYTIWDVARDAMRK
jgi:ATP synthase protein I